MMAALEKAERAREERERALREDCVIYCRKYGLWWGPNGRGYTPDLTQAGVYSPDEAARRAESGVDEVRKIADVATFAEGTVGALLRGAP